MLKQSGTTFWIQLLLTHCTEINSLENSTLYNSKNWAVDLKLTLCIGFSPGTPDFPMLLLNTAVQYWLRLGVLPCPAQQTKI